MTDIRRRPGDGTGGLRTGATTFEALREQAIALRREGLSLRQIRDSLSVHNNDLLHRLVKGEPPPEWTKRPNAKDDLRAKARELRLQGMTYDEIQIELGCSKSSICLWVRDLPKPEPTHRPPGTDMVRANQGRAEAYTHRKAGYEAQRQAAQQEIGGLTERELFLIGVGLYWAEGGKTTLKRHNPRTNRKNVGDTYHGCLRVRVLKGSDLYRRIEGAWCGIVGAIN
ncbi:hypothetical protein [Streptomyces sp. NPDC046685]|uniref:helix-turn-helix domain-containing protein n=1 Tax=Streptomyces sp. NPDC046685 TaxID=3157202 RepID=UPI0033D0E9E4